MKLNTEKIYNGYHRVMIKVTKPNTQGITIDHINHNTPLSTSKHLSYEERFYIEKQLQANISKSAIIKAPGCSRTTIHTKIRRGTIVQIK